MSSLVENATIKIRRDSAANWTSNNPTPASGEWCYETDTRHIKIGDGSTAWNSLTYHIGGSDIKNITTASDETETLPGPSDIGGAYIIGRYGAGSGKATFNAPGGATIRWPDGFASSRIVFEGGGNATVVERAGELYVQEYTDSGSNSNGSWEKSVNGKLKQWANDIQLGLTWTANERKGIGWTLPITFSNDTYISTSEFQPDTSDDWYGFIYQISTTSTATVANTVVRNGGTSQGVVGSEFTAFGDWDRDAA